ncbi:NAD(P)-binding protein [Daedalea quercina L-15889]|uniref:NAD(P)-binding protein n=1 Tax=Daedalea quercina L-15889 TaxID=1314783 RepID=A0A165Q9W0_9APHY|nr:NAD(P)-binding protein [Daedalea quercina L-15889]
MGTLLSFLKYAGPIHRQSRPPEPVFSTDHIPDLTGRVILVTGGNAGIGKETVRVLLEHNAKVYMAAKDQKDAEAAIEELRAKTGKEALFLELNLANLASVRRASEKFLSMEQELHVLYNNAGVSSVPIDWLTDDGYDMTFGVNVVGHFLLTQLLMPTLKAGKNTSPDHHSRIIWVSSFASYLSPIYWDTFKDTPQRRKIGSDLMYAQSKLAGVMLAREYVKRYGDHGIVALSVNPGNIKTGILRHAPKFNVAFTNLFIKLYPVEYGALTQLWAGTMPEALEHNGEYVVPWARITDRARPEAYDDQLCTQLWDWLENEVKEA